MTVRSMTDRMLGALRLHTAAYEEIVPREVIGADPNRTIVPAMKVVAVVEEPGACHPSPLQGRYGRDHDFFHDYHRATRTVEGFDAWTAEWVTGVRDRREYLRKLGPRWQRLRISDGGRE